MAEVTVIHGMTSRTVLIIDYCIDYSVGNYVLGQAVCYMPCRQHNDEGKVRFGQLFPSVRSVCIFRELCCACMCCIGLAII